MSLVRDPSPQLGLDKSWLRESLEFFSTIMIRILQFILLTLDLANDKFFFRFDYGEKFWIIKSKMFTCTCGADKCKYSEATIEKTLAAYNKKMQQEDDR